MTEPSICPKLPQYYRDLGDASICNAFKAFDNVNVFRKLEDKVRQHHSKNFVLDFGDDDDAFCAFDLSAGAVEKLIKAPRPTELPTRWINVWMPHKQADLIRTLAKQFDFSPRQFGFMLSQPIQKPAFPQSARVADVHHLRRRNPVQYPQPVSDPSAHDIEDGISLHDVEFDQSYEADLATDFNQYNLANEAWHWSSVDWGRRFLCIGYNSLYPCPENHHSRPPLDGDSDIGEGDCWREHDLPKGKRVWSWLILCEDRTVITIHEDPFPHCNGPLDASEQRSLLIIRRNLINVFRNCSKACDLSHQPAVTRLPIRNRMGGTDEETAHRPTDVPGLLFFCLFDDWYGSYSIVFRREHRYDFELEQLRAQMMRRAELSHINRLHHIGRQLSVLKRMFQSYELIIDRVLAKQEPTVASLKNSNVISGINTGVQSMENSMPQVAESDSLLGVSLSSAARVRFERLGHRIRLYALNEIEECIAQKDALVMMNFNLIAIVESLSVERLTRITLLLAKVTILFMPVSLMSAYFSAQLSDVSFNNRQYWMWFGIIFAMSLLGVIVFSVMSGTFEGGVVYKTLGRRLIEGYRQPTRKLRRHKKL